MAFFNTFFEGRIDLYNKYKLFEAKHRIRIINKLSQEENQDQFLSKVSEVNFGIFFDNLNSRIFYEKVYDNYTPDWTIEINGQRIIAEVLRLNPSAVDRRSLAFEDEFINKINEIKIGCFLEFNYDKSLIDTADIDIAACKTSIENWLRKKPIENSVLVLVKNVHIVLLYFKESFNHVCLSISGGGIKFDYRRLNSDKSALVNKAKKYTSIIDKYGLPYIICIYMDPHT